jgi:hypothetical protein
MKRELRLTYEDYEIYKHQIGASPNNLAYDRGVVVTYDVAPTGTGLVGMVVNGNGKTPASEGSVEGKFDDDKYKNYAARVSQPLFGLAQVGYFFYYGEESYESVDFAPNVYKNRIRYHGPDLVLGNGMFDLTAQYLLRWDTNPDFTTRASEVQTAGVVAELVISPQRDRSRLYGTLLFNWIESDHGRAAGDPGVVYETYTASLTYLFARNLRGTLEYTYDDVDGVSRGGIGLVTAF